MTDVPLKDYVDRLLAEQKESVRLALEAISRQRDNSHFFVAFDFDDVIHGSLGVRDTSPLTSNVDV